MASKHFDGVITVGCGQCIGCRLDYSRDWAIRIMHEAQMHDANSFLTLTYNDEHLPETGGLVLDHWQQFAKRARRKFGSFRFFHCGEYGDETYRPHYHAAIFGKDWSHDRKFHKKTPQGHKLYTSPSLTKTWGKGHAYIGQLSHDSAAYVARYIMKKINGQLGRYHYTRFDYETGKPYTLRKEYCTMSRNPGLGKKWIEKYIDDVYPSDEVIFKSHPTIPPPFYDAHLALENPTLLKQIKQQRIVNAAKHEDNNTPERLAVREKVKFAQIKQLTRSF